MDAVKNKLPAFNPKDVLPKGRSYYFYKGSLTTPPCTEVMSMCRRVQTCA